MTEPTEELSVIQKVRQSYKSMCIKETEEVVNYFINLLIMDNAKNIDITHCRKSNELVIKQDVSLPRNINIENICNSTKEAFDNGLEGLLYINALSTHMEILDMQDNCECKYLLFKNGKFAFAKTGKNKKLWGLSVTFKLDEKLLDIDLSNLSYDKLLAPELVASNTIDANITFSIKI